MRPERHRLYLKTFLSSKHVFIYIFTCFKICDRIRNKGFMFHSAVLTCFFLVFCFCHHELEKPSRGSCASHSRFPPHRDCAWNWIIKTLDNCLLCVFCLYRLHCLYQILLACTCFSDVPPERHQLTFLSSKHVFIYIFACLKSVIRLELKVSLIAVVFVFMFLVFCFC